jgi:hypothetical protein
MENESTVRQHDSDRHYGLTYISYQSGENLIVADAGSDEQLLECSGADIIFWNRDLNVHDLAEVVTIASGLTKERT